jgi:two-component system, sensor histidine kinase and response regulator
MRILASIRTRLIGCYLALVAILFTFGWISWESDTRIESLATDQYSYYRWAILTAGAIALTSVVFWIFERSILRPLTRATTIASAIAQGNFNNSIAVTGPDETSGLLHALSQLQISILENIAKVSADKTMLNNANAQLHFTLLELKTREKELESYKYELEKMVNDRTYELAKNNEQLTKEIARRQQVEQDLVAAKEIADAANRAKSQFLAHMSHEIRTPMNGVIGMVDLLRQTELTPRQGHFAAVIQQSARALLKIINDLLDFSKIEAGGLTLDLGTVDLRASVEEVANLLAEAAQKKGVELTCIVSAAVPELVRGDGARVRQVLVNLVGNAIKFTERGDVAIQVDAIAMGMSDGHVRVRLEVRDTGIGIPKSALANIFDAFQQVEDAPNRKFEGTGLGLSIVRQLVNVMGGRIEVESEIGRGSVFRVELTFASLKPPSAAARFLTTFPGKRALIVDDNATSRRIIELHLAKLRIVGTSVDSADAALQALALAHRSGRAFDLAIVDAVMPAMTGVDLAQRIRADATTANLPLVMLTSLGQAAFSGVEATMGPFASVTKPVREAEFHEQIGYVLSPRSLTISNLVAIEGDTVGRINAMRPPLNLQILVAEDSPVNQEIAYEQLISFGCQVDIASNGSEALAAFETSEYDLVLMDCQMPEMDGFEATRRIHDRLTANGSPRRVPIIALTAYASAQDRERCLGAGMDDCLTKPFEAEDLYRIVNRWAPNCARADAPAEPVVIAPLKPGETGSTLDGKVIRSLRRAPPSGNGASLLTKMGRLYLDSMPKDLADLESAIERDAAETVTSIAHKLKSVAGNIGAWELATLFKDLEDDALAMQLGEASTTLRQIKIEFQRTAIALQQEMADA